eukprot:jgi/Botrbrau1/18693/Bobra.0386s0020.2
MLKEAEEGVKESGWAGEKQQDVLEVYLRLLMGGLALLPDEVHFWTKSLSSGHRELPDRVRLLGLGLMFLLMPLPPGIDGHRLLLALCPQDPSRPGLTPRAVWISFHISHGRWGPIVLAIRTLLQKEYRFPDRAFGQMSNAAAGLVNPDQAIPAALQLPAIRGLNAASAEPPYALQCLECLIRIGCLRPMHGADAVDAMLSQLQHASLPLHPLLVPLIEAFAGVPLKDAMGGRPLPKGPLPIPALPYGPLDAALVGDYGQRIRAGHVFPLLAVFYLLSRDRVLSPHGLWPSNPLGTHFPLSALGALMGAPGPNDPYAPLRPRWTHVTSTSPYASEPAPSGVYGPGLCLSKLLPLLKLPGVQETGGAGDNGPAAGTVPREPRLPPEAKGGALPRQASGSEGPGLPPAGTLPDQARGGVLPPQASGSTGPGLPPGGTLPDQANGASTCTEAARVMGLAAASPSLAMAFLQRTPITGTAARDVEVAVEIVSCLVPQLLSGDVPPCLATAFLCWWGALPGRVARKLLPMLLLRLGLPLKAQGGSLEYVDLLTRPLLVMECDARLWTVPALARLVVGRLWTCWQHQGGLWRPW